MNHRLSPPTGMGMDGIYVGVRERRKFSELTLPGVEIPGQTTAFFHLSMVPAVVRSVEGRDVIWPLSSQPHIRIELQDDDTLLIRSDYLEATVAISPDWLIDASGVKPNDEQLGWPPLRVKPGTWRLTRDGRLLYENRPGSA